jgi:hypothetical protein
MSGRRPDGTLARAASPIRRFQPFHSPRRNDSLVLFSQELAVEEALRFVAGRRRVVLKWSYDERTEDGVYCAAGLERIRELIENPEKLA